MSASHERSTDDLDLRAGRFAALGDRTRLAIVESLRLSDRSPSELRVEFGLESNLLAHHLAVLEEVGIVERSRSHGDGRRRYVRLVVDPLSALAPAERSIVGPVVFVCTANAARSQLASALWCQLTGAPSTSAGTHPAAAIHPGAVAAGVRAGLTLGTAAPTALDLASISGERVVTVCDSAHEELGHHQGWIHWSVPDPVVDPADDAFDRTILELRTRIERALGSAA